MEKRICNTCGEEKLLSEDFYRKSSYIRKDKTQGISFMKKCLICHNEWQMKNYFNNKSIEIDNEFSICKHCGIQKINSEFKTTFMCLVCFENKKIEQDKQYRKTHKKEKSIKDKKYRSNNKSLISKNKKEYYIANKSKFIERNLRNEKKRRQTDPIFRLRKSVSASIKKAIKKNGKSFTKYLPYTIQELKDHIESQFEPWMNWNNQGIYKLDTWDDNDQSTWVWNIDHIIPHSRFQYSSMEDQEFKNCWALDNLRPYSAKQNIIDGSRK